MTDDEDEEIVLPEKEIEDSDDDSPLMELLENQDFAQDGDHENGFDREDML